MKNMTTINPDNGEFAQVGLKVNITSAQIEEIIQGYFIKKENILKRKLTPEEKIAISTIFRQAIEEGECNPAIIMEIFLPSTGQHFKQFSPDDKPEIRFRNPKKCD